MHLSANPALFINKSWKPNNYPVLLIFLVGENRNRMEGLEFFPKRYLPKCIFLKCFIYPYNFVM